MGWITNIKRSKILRMAAVLVPVICLAVLLATTALAQNTYIITDGDQVVVHTSYAWDPKRVLSEAGVRLEANDSYTTQITDGVSEITVQRAKRVTILNTGYTMVVSSYEETVQQLLDRLGIPTNGNFRVSEALDTPTCDGMRFSVDYVISQPETYTVDIPYDTVYCFDPNMGEGQARVVAPGKDGQKLLHTNAVYVNTREESRTVLSETVVKQPENRIIAIGTGDPNHQNQDLPLIGDGVIVLPSGEVLTYTKAEQFVATAYSKTNAGCDDITATGSQVRVGVVAVDPKLIPYGTRMFIVTNDGRYIYGIGTAEDCGGSIKGNRLDLYFDTDAECWQFGVRSCTVYFLGDANWR